MIEAIGVVETYGLAALVQATDAMLKCGVRYAGWSRLGGGQCTVYVRGEIQAVRFAVDAGASAARAAGEVRNVRVIADPDPALEMLLPGEKQG